MSKTLIYKIVGTALAAALGAVAPMAPAPFNMIVTALAGALTGWLHLSRPGDVKVTEVQ